MGYDSRITITTVQFDVDADEPITVSYPAVWHTYRGIQYIRYTERAEPSADGGEREPGNGTTTTIRIDGTKAEITRKGEIRAHMLYAPGVKNKTYYDSPMGRLRMEIQTTRVKVTQKEDRLILIAGYDLSLNGAYVSRCRMTITVERQNDNTRRI